MRTDKQRIKELEKALARTDLRLEVWFKLNNAYRQLTGKNKTRTNLEYKLTLVKG